MTNLPVVKNNIHHLDTIFFMYKAGPSASDQHIGYSGPNRAPGEGWAVEDRYYASKYNPATLVGPDGNSFPIGRRYCAAGWVRNVALNTRTDTVEFAFEDNQNTKSTYDFNDIIFHASGIFLIKPAVVNRVELDAVPATGTIRAGDSVSFTASVYIDTVDQFGVATTVLDTARSGNVTWHIEGNTVGAVLTGGEGPSRTNIFTATRAYRHYTIVATIVDGPQIVTAAMKITVVPNDPFRLYAEGAHDTLDGLDLNRPNPIDTLTIPGSVIRDSIYAVIRDRYGNYTGAATSASWSVLSGISVISVATGRASIGEGIVIREAVSGLAVVRVADISRPDQPLFADSFAVLIDAGIYDALRFVVGSGGQKRVITSLSIDQHDDTLVLVEAHSQNGIGGDNGWFPVNGRWMLSGTLTSSNPAPASSNQFLFAPDDTGQGSIQLSYANLVGMLPVTVIPAGPVRIELYGQEGTPGGQNAPYLSPGSYTYVRSAGSQMPLAAKLFDRYNNWLPAYESAPLNQLISWTLRNAVTGIAIAVDQAELIPVAGHFVQLVPKRAGLNILAIATFVDGPYVYRDTVRVSTVAGPAEFLTIEATADPTISPYTSNRLGQIEIANTDSTVSVYAILRDRYGNYVRPSDSTTWTARDTTVLTVAAGARPDSGQGDIARKTTAQSQTWVRAGYRAFNDSVRVTINSVTYDAVQIYVLDGGVKPITSLVIRTDQDTTLYARGKRSDNGQWIDVPVAWSSGSLQLFPSAPGSSRLWSFEPTATGTGRIIITRSGTWGTVADTVQVTVNPGLPAKLLIYARGASEPLPSIEITGTIVAGRDTVLVARLFDHLDVPLSATAQFSWATTLISGIPPAGVLSIQANDTANFSSTAAYKIVDISATYPTGSAPLSASVRFRVVPDTAARLFIEPSPFPSGIKLNESDELTGAEIQATDTITWVYAVLRDQYSNFVSPSLSTMWSSFTTSIVEAFEGVAANGEGVIVRRGREGTTMVSAYNVAKPYLADSIPVSITISYDSLRIVVENNGTQVLESLTMRTDQDTTLFVQGKRSDNGRWEYVQARWNAAGRITLTPGAPQSASIYTFAPADTGSGTLAVSLGTSVGASIAVRFLAGLPCRVVIYPRLGAPQGANIPYPPSDQRVTARAGHDDTLVAKVFDCNGVWLSSYESSQTHFSWLLEEIAGTPPSGTLHADGASLARFSPRRAQNRVYVIVTFSDNGRTFSDSVQFAIAAGDPHHLVLEASQNPQVSPFADNPIDTVIMTRNMDYARVYAIVRDRYENWVGYSTDNLWWSLDTGIVAVEDGNTVIGEGIITRILSRNDIAVTDIRVTSLTWPQLTDSVVVSLLNISYDSLIITVVPVAQRSIGNLVMSTNDDTTLLALGLRSDTKIWEPAQVQWHTSAGIATSPSAPERAVSWRFSPTVPVATGSIWISVDDTATVVDTIDVTFTRGAPLRARIELLTPPDQRIAGEPIVALVSLENRDGLVPGPWCFSSDSAAVYRDRLSSGGLAHTPTITVNGVEGPLNVNNTVVHTSDQCFADGIDTISFIIYHAPADSFHRISALLGSINAVSPDFLVLPHTPVRIELVDRRDGTPLPDTLVLTYPNDAVLIEVRGYDRYGNPTGALQSRWETTGGIPPATPNISTSVYYTVSSAQDNVAGTLRVVSLGTDTPLTDSVFIRVQGFYPDVIAAITRDSDGNGYLDRIDLTFSNRVELDESWLRGIAVSHDGIPFTIDSISYGPDSTTVQLHLREPQINPDGTRPPPQTSWTPLIELDLFDGQLNRSVVAADGAGPVIWSVTKRMHSATDRSSDIVTIVFSEPVLTDNTRPTINYAPGDIFTVWEIDPLTGQMREVTSMLGGIDLMFAIVNDSTFSFIMTNGRDLMIRNFISINTSHGILTDKASTIQGANPPHLENRRVSVVLVTPPPEAALIYPNPALPDLRNPSYPPGELELKHEPAARRWVRDGKGIVFSFTLPQPAANEVVRGHIKIYDVAGNLVSSGTSEDLLAGFAQGLSAYDVDAYWNGTNTGGMPAAPGIYRYIIYLSYTVTPVNNTRLYGSIGIRR